MDQVSDERPRSTTAHPPAPAGPSNSSGKGGSRCRPCSDTGELRWQQPVPDGDGGLVLREMTHPCTCQAARDAGTWRHPAAEADRVIDTHDHAPVDSPAGAARGGGQAAAVQRLQPGLAAFLAAASPLRPSPGSGPGHGRGGREV